MKEVIEKLVPDTNALVDSIISKRLEKNELKVEEIIIHEAVLAELEHQANRERAIGYLGLEEIKRLHDLTEKYDFKLRFAGMRPKAAEIKYASIGEIDAMIRELAFDEDATLLTLDKIQAKVAEAKGIKILFIEKIEEKIKVLMLDKFFDETTMSVHLKEDVAPYAKKGIPGNWGFFKLREETLKQDEIKDMSQEIIEEAKIRKDGFIEIERKSSTIVQLGLYRIVITKPPFSDGWEITAVRPVKRLDLKDYNLNEKLRHRVEEAEGILIAGAPGHGKTTFAQALAEHYASKGKIVKTVEAPRDLILSDEITQYAISHGDAQEIHDILLLSRPDYTIFDEMRNTGDFKLFADLRLAGIGFLGVIHATNPIDAIQRFIGRVELGVIPQIIDTVIFIRNGQVDKVLSLKMVVKVPEGMTEADLARPVVTVTDFETQKAEYEIYSYGEETVVIPVSVKKVKPADDLAVKQIENEMQKYVSDVKAEIVSDHKAVIYVPEEEIGQLIGKKGKNIEQIERKLGIKLEVKELTEEEAETEKQTTEYDTSETKKFIIFNVNPKFSGKTVDIYLDDAFLFPATVSKKGIIKINKKTKSGATLSNALNSHKDIVIRI